ncbi:MAG: sigma-54 dependent transcriptional regulator [Bdellovibrionota bacterium]
MAHILVIEDNTTMREGIVQILESMHLDVYGASNGKEGLEYFHMTQPDLVITDLKMEEIDGMQVLQEIKKHTQNTLVLMITAFGTIELAVEAMQLGAFDFITKPFPPNMLRVKVNKALDVLQTKAENSYLRQQQMKKTSMMLIGKSEAMHKVQQQIKKVASLDDPILITGESGTGKDLLSRTIHQIGPRAHKPFVKVDCTAFTDEFLESELFGHERNAFPEASQRKQGKFELASGGTLFLDNIDKISSAMQTKILKILQDRSFTRKGGNKKIGVSVRMISATSKRIQKDKELNLFNPQLLQILQSTHIQLPPLRERREDIKDLILFFLTRENNKTGKDIQVSNDAMNVLAQYTWPGNIRELQSIVQHISSIIKTDIVQKNDIPTEIQNNAIIDGQK